METTIGDLRSAIKKAIKAVDTASCAIRCEDGKLSIIASSAQGSIMIDVPAQGGGERRSANISSKQVGAIFGGVVDSFKCTIKKAGDGITLSFGGSRIKLLQPFEDGVTDMFQTAVAGTPDLMFSSTGKELSELLNGPVQYAAKNDVRHYFVGVQAISDGGRLRLTGTNGVKLCTARSGIQTSEEMKECIIPRPVAEAIGSVFESTDLINVHQIGDIGNMRFLLGNDRIKWVTSAIAGKYPDWKRIMPSDRRTAGLELARDSVVSAITRIMAASGEQFVVVVFEKNGIHIKSTDGEQREFFEGKTGIESEICVGATGSALAETVEAVETTVVDFSINIHNEVTRFVVRPSGPKIEISDWIGICMPAKI